MMSMMQRGLGLTGPEAGCRRIRSAAGERIQLGWRKSGWLALWSAALLALGAGRGVAQPANDNFANAQIISGQSGSVMGSTVGATVEVGEPPVTDPLTGQVFNGAS